MVGEADLSSRDVLVRRAAARALARIATSAARPGLLRALGDEDQEVVSWAAYGLGFDCTEKEATVTALVARALALGEVEGSIAFGPIARAIGRCASVHSETTLVAWLDGPADRAREAALALGDFAGRSKQLREDTIASLLARAEGSVSSPPLAEALYPFSRLENVPQTVRQRLADVARARLPEQGPLRLFAIRALGRTREAGLEALEGVLVGQGATFTMPERVEAARAASRLGNEGQALLVKALPKLSLDAPTLADSPDTAAVAGAVVTALTGPRGVEKELDTLARLEAPQGGGPRQRRALSTLRCAAARVLAGDRPTEPRLVACDLDGGTIGKLALASVLGKTKLTGPALKTFRDLLADPDVRVRQAALALLPGHPEIEDSAAVLKAALEAKEGGVATTAAEQIKTAPNLAADKNEKRKQRERERREKEKEKEKGKEKDADKKPKPQSSETPPQLAADPAVVAALISLLERAQKEHDLEMLAAAVDAIGALGLKEHLAKIEILCKSDNPTAREHARAAIGLLSGTKGSCPAPDQAELATDSLEAAKPVTFSLETDAGELEISLDPILAPVTTIRIADLVRQGYYDGGVIHRVDPSFVVQFGSPHGDGFGGPTDRPALRCETSPHPFEHLSVGLALAGRDTGSSQLFVMRARHPHLDGQYPIVGKASGPWDQVVEGDVIKKATIVAR
jgi:cyclophilin family peptidyl-prolyl cis-trans isomerase